MGEAVGIDLGTAVSAVARRRGDVIEPRLVPTAELAGPGDTAGALAALAGAAGDLKGRPWWSPWSCRPGRRQAGGGGGRTAAFGAPA